MSNDGRLFGINYRTGGGVLVEGTEILQFNHHNDLCDDDQETSKCWSVNGKVMRGAKAMRKLLGSEHPSGWRLQAVKLYLEMTEQLADQVIKLGEDTHPPFDIVIIQLVPMIPEYN